MSANPVDSDFFMNLESEDSWPLHGCQRWLSPAFSQQSLKCLPSSSLPPPNPPRSVLSRALIKMERGTCHPSSSFLPPWEYEPEAFRWPDLKSHTCCRCYFAHLTLYAVFFCSLPPGHIILLDANRGCKNTCYQGLPGDSRPDVKNHDLRNKLTDMKVLCHEVLVLEGFPQSFMIIVLTIWLIF